jgi:hypothetical protein
MFSLFSKKNKVGQREETARFYIGVAADEYGRDFNLAAFVQGKFDEKFKNKFFFDVFIENKKFDNLVDAVKHTSRRGVTNNSAYVIGLKCTIDEIDTYRERGEFSNLIFSITNAMTGKAVSKTPDMVLNPENIDKNSDRPHSPPVKVN